MTNQYFNLKEIVAIIIIVVSTVFLVSFVGYAGYGIGTVIAREKIIIHCIENPDKCTEEYNYYKLQKQVSQYTLPTIKNSDPKTK